MIDWNGDFESLGMNLFPLELLVMLAEAVNERLAAVHFPTAGSPDQVDVPSAGANSCSQTWWRSLQDEVESMQSVFLSSTHPDDDSTPTYPPFRRKRPRQIYSSFAGIMLEEGGSPTTGMRSRHIKNPSTSDPGNGKVYEFNGTTWVETSNPLGDMPDTRAIEGKIEVGDYIGGYLAADLRDMLNLMKITQEAVGRYGVLSEVTTIDVLGTFADAFDWVMANPTLYGDASTPNFSGVGHFMSDCRWTGGDDPENAYRDPDVRLAFRRLHHPTEFPIAGTATIAMRTDTMGGGDWDIWDSNGLPVVEGDWNLTDYEVAQGGNFDQTYLSDDYEPNRCNDPVGHIDRRHPNRPPPQLRPQLLLD